jgi:hypothetical protein
MWHLGEAPQRKGNPVQKWVTSIRAEAVDPPPPKLGRKRSIFRTLRSELPGQQRLDLLDRLRGR